MPESAQLELVEVEGREIKLRWKSSRFGEWLAWCYLPALNLMHNQGVGFEARAATAEDARALCIEKVRAHLAGPGVE